MQIRNPQPQIINAIVAMLAPYAPEVNAANLVEALAAYQGNAQPRMTKPLTRRQAADALNVSLQTVNRYMNSGVLRRIAYGKRAVRVDAATVQDVIENGVPADYLRNAEAAVSAN